MSRTNPKTTHGQITFAIKQAARGAQLTANDAYNQFFRELFLHSLAQLNRDWVLKGGANVYCRIPGARQTKDLDLYRQSPPTSAGPAADSLVATMNGHRAGPYIFSVERTGSSLGGPIESERVRVTVRYGVNARLVDFYVDVSGDLIVTSQAEALRVRPTFAINTPILPEEFEVLTYPVANQVADKFCAMYERHGTKRPGRASTRYHDLYDLALIATELEVQAEELDAALRSQASIRGLELPHKVTVPDDLWREQYESKAQQFNGGDDQFRDLSKAIHVVGRFLDPILSGTLRDSSSTWMPRSMEWVIAP